MSRFAMRTLLCVVGALLFAAALAPVALADAAGPTDYNTEIVSIEPASTAILVEMIGGDSFLSLEQLEPVEVVVLGYQAEPYLRFDIDGTVYENRRSPSVWLNQERYGDSDLPAFADAAARPEWFEVATNGRYAWHDHRSHWMNPQQPPGAEAGDQVLEATVPIRVGGEAVTITVASFLLDSPSRLPMLFGIVASLVFGAFVGRLDRVRRTASALVLGSAAAAHGVIAFVSVPSETQPSQLLWLLPAVTVIAAAIVLLTRNLTATTVYLDGLTVISGACLVGWAIYRSSALQRALIPSDAPAGLDRFVITVAMIVGVMIATYGLVGLLRPQRLRSPAPSRLA